MTQPKSLLLAALLLAVPLTASAQALSLDEALKVYRATERIDREVWANNPDEAAKVRHMLWLFHDSGIYPGSFPRPWEIDPNTEMREETIGENCFRYYDDEAGEWRERCSDWRTYRCNNQSQIDEIKSLAHGAYWMQWAWGGAAATAGFFLRPDLAYWFTLHALAMNATSHLLNDQIAKMEQSRCVNP